jgi:hypothetical protein
MLGRGQKPLFLKEREWIVKENKWSEGSGMRDLCGGGGKLTP